MREEFYENSVGPQNERTQKFFYRIYQFLFGLAVAVLIIMLYFFLLWLDVGFLVFAGIALLFGTGCFFVKRRLMNYFDYTFVSGEIRIVKVINGKSRKLKFKFDSKDVYQVGKVGSESYEKLSATPGIKVNVVTPNGFSAQKQLYYIAAKILGENQLIVLECEEKFLSYIVMHRGNSIIEKDYK